MRYLILVLLLTTGCNGMFTKTKEPVYTLVEQAGEIEIRDYAPMAIAQIAITEKDRMDAANAGFMPLANYIFAKNRGGEKLAMTAPVQQQPLEQGWGVTFVMPDGYNVKNLPKSEDNRVVIKDMPKTRYAVISFSGRPTDSNVSENETKLNDFIKTRKLKTIGKPLYNYYNPPWTPPCMRRNEVWIELKS